MKLSEIKNKIPTPLRRLVEKLALLLNDDRNDRYTNEEIVSVPVTACLQNKSINYTAKYPDDAIIRERLSESLSVNKIREMIKRDRPRLREKVILAFDEHDERFYGDKNTEGVIGVQPKEGTSWAFSYLAAKIITRDKEYIVDILPLYDRDLEVHTMEMMKELVKEYRIDLILIDSGFRDTKLFELIVGLNMHFITKLRTSKNLREKDILCNTAIEYVSIYEKGTYNSVGKALFVYRLRNKKGEEYYLISDKKDDATTIKDEYRSRWGIETGFREVNRMEIKTTTKDPTMRYFFYVVSVLMYNIWISIRSRFSEVVIRLDFLRDVFLKTINAFMKIRGNLLQIMGVS